MIWAKIASFLLFIGIALGAFGSHALRDQMNSHATDIYKTAVFYHLINALGLFAVSWLSTTNQDPKITWAGILLTTGIMVFSGSLYLLAVSGSKILGVITPVGGLALLAGWFLLFMSIK